MIIQTLRKKEGDEYGIAERYYSILSSVNSLLLTKRETQLIAYTAIKGNISYSQFKEEFCTKHKTSVQTINNMISRLKRLKIFIKDNGKIKVAPAIALKFDDGIKMEIWIGQ